MVNKTAPEMVARIERLAYEEGLSVRQIMARTGVAKATIQKYYPRDARCPGCDKLLVEHRGWCATRFSESKNRQTTIKKLHEAQAIYRKAQRAMKAEARKLGLEWKGGRWISSANKKPKR